MNESPKDIAGGSEDALSVRQDARELLISHLYDIAVDPAHYHSLREWWDNVFLPAWPEEPMATRITFDADTEAHFRRAAALLDQAEMRPQAEDPILAMLDVFQSRAALILDERLVIRAATPAATRLLGAAVGEGLSKGKDCEDSKRTLGAVLDARLRGDPGATGVFRLEGKELDRPLVVFLRHQALPDGSPGLLVVMADFVWQPGAIATLRAAFDLTSAEADVARLVAEGLSVKEIARARRASPETVRKQVQAVYRKTNARSQVELSRAVLSIADIATFTEPRHPADFMPAATSLPRLPFRQAFGRDGRRLDYLVLGDPEGRPVLYLGLDFGFVRLTASAETAAAQAGLRLLSPIPAGYGQSDPIPKGRDYTETSTADLLAVLDAENVRRCPVLSCFRTYHAVSLIEACPDRITALIQAPACFPVETRAQYERMHKWHRFINGAARYTPGVLPFLLQAGFHLARKYGRRNFLEAIYGSSPGDMAVVADPEALEAMMVGSEVFLGPGVPAYRAFDHVVAYSREPWAERLRALEGRLPVHALQGADDPYCPPETLAEMRAAYPWIEVEVIDDAGELLIFSHWRRAFALIDPHA
jgi:DNA-binding CsgD family transcriptional regulator/pimeloyl-ACP methyl ester carboxylesterase